MIFLIRFNDLSYRAVFGLTVAQGVGVSRSRLPASLFEHSPLGQANNSSTFRTAACAICALTPHQARAATACVSTPRDWAVSIGSHMRPRHGHFYSASTSKRTVSVGSDCSRQKPRSKKLAVTIPTRWVSARIFRNACLTPRPAQDVFFPHFQMMQKSKEKQHRFVQVLLPPRTSVFDTTYTKAANVSNVFHKMA